MTGPEHYRQAERRRLFKAENESARGDNETPASCAAIAGVHATLALAAATPAPVRRDARGTPTRGWTPPPGSSTRQAARSERQRVRVAGLPA